MLEKNDGLFNKWPVLFLPEQKPVRAPQSVKILVIEGPCEVGLKDELSTERLEE